LRAKFADFTSAKALISSYWAGAIRPWANSLSKSKTTFMEPLSGSRH
jgi:hypothetical protein